jgi:hypothetical protein
MTTSFQMMNLLLAVHHLDEHKCHPAQFSEVASAVSEACKRASSLSEVAYTTMLLAVMREKARARVNDPIPLDAVAYRAR